MRIDSTMPPNRLLLACVLTLLSTAVLAAPSPRLDKAAPTLCPASDKTKWKVSAAQAVAVEKALPAYFAVSKAPARKLPDTQYVYGRQYEGVTRNGKRYIQGRFYPANHEVATLRPDSCWTFDDGGNAFWHVIFDPETGAIVDFGVNFSA